MNPSVYLYDERDGEHRLYLAEFSTIDGLNQFPNDSPIRIEELYADAHNTTDCSQIDTVETAIHYLRTLEAFSLVDFSCKIAGAIRLSTHDDAEWHFTTNNRAECQRLVLATSPDEQCGKLWERLTSNIGQYVALKSTGRIATYADFDSYLNSTRSG